MHTILNEQIGLTINNIENDNASHFKKRSELATSFGLNYLPDGERQRESSFSVLNRINESYSQLSVEWLVTGKGSMYTSPLED